MTELDAVLQIEGGEDGSLDLEAWSTLIRSGTVWHLQGFYGRGASNLIERGIISESGEILDASY